MAQRTYWKGYLKLSLVTCPVTMMPATSDAERVKFRTLNRKTGNPVVSRYVDAVSQKPVEPEDQVKGYPRGEDDYVLLEDEELDSVALDSTRTIDIETFVPVEAIEWVWYDTPYYLMPSDPVGEEAFAVILQAMRAAGQVGIARLVMGGRERAVMLSPRDRGIVLWTLRFGDEVRKTDEVFGKIGRDKPDPDLMRLVETLIDNLTAPWDPDLLKDPVQDNLRQIIAAKTKKERKAVPKAQKEAAPQGNVISIMDALRKSIDGEKKR
jgi:DNA end-binding protein Ku